MITVVSKQELATLKAKAKAWDDACASARAHRAEKDWQVEAELAKASGNGLWSVVLAIASDYAERQADAAISPPPTVQGEGRVYNAGRAAGVYDLIAHLLAAAAAAEHHNADPGVA